MPDNDTVAAQPPSPPATVDQTTQPPASAASPVTEPTAKPHAEPSPVPITADPVSEEDITVRETPVALTERPEFCPEEQVREEELISLHGYAIGMTSLKRSKYGKSRKI
jgi:hypothetical protein